MWHQPLHSVTIARCYDTQHTQLRPRTTKTSVVPFPTLSAISGGPRYPWWQYLGKGWCPQSRRGWWSACCSHWSTAASPGCSSGAPSSAHGSRPWPGRWQQGTPPPHAAGAKGTVSTLVPPPGVPRSPPPLCPPCHSWYLGSNCSRRHPGPGSILGTDARVPPGRRAHLGLPQVLHAVLAPLQGRDHRLVIGAGLGPVLQWARHAVHAGDTGSRSVAGEVSS